MIDHDSKTEAMAPEMTSCFRLIAIVVTGLSVLARTPPASAEPAVPSGWSVQLTTYSWASWLTGEGGVAGRTFNVAMDPIELIDHLDWDQIPVWMSYTEARRGGLFLFNDIVYAKLQGSSDFARSRNRHSTSLSLGADIDADVEQLTVELGAGFTLGQRGSAGTAGFTAFDLLAGARYWRQEVDLSVDVTATLDIQGLTISGGRAFARSGTVDWVDPFIGARLRHQLAPGEEIVVRGDIGGFGVGSDFSWQAIATYNWHLCDFAGMQIDTYLGYRAISVDYQQGSGLKEYEYDVIQHGPVVGLTSHF